MPRYAAPVVRTFLLLGLLGLVALPASPAEAAAPAWTYEVRFAAGLERATVRVRFRGYRPKRLVLARMDALSAVRPDPAPRADGRPAWRPNPARNGVLPRIEADGDGLTYDVDFRALARITAAAKETTFVGRDLVTRGGLFLLHPARWPLEARVRIQLELPPGTHAAVGWPRDVLASNAAGRTVYTLPRHAMPLHARVAFGRFAPRRIPVPGGDVIAYSLDAPRRATDEGIDRWLATAMGAVTQLYGKPPAPRTHVIVQPLVPGRGRPVVFGRATLSGGPVVHAMLSGTTTDAAMPGEWITIHELLHLGMPVTTLADRWFGEGFVSYYQEIVRARAGIQTPQQAWQTMHMWFERGKRSGGRRSLADESRLMTHQYAYHRVYWGGAALALQIDLAIREATGGRQSLDDVMRYFLAQHVDAARVVDARELMRRADAFLGRAVCVPHAERALRSRAFPSLDAAYARLGLEVRGGQVTLRADAPAASHRDAIMRTGGR